MEFIRIFHLINLRVLSGTSGIMKPLQIEIFKLQQLGEISVFRLCSRFAITHSLLAANNARDKRAGRAGAGGRVQMDAKVWQLWRPHV